MEKLIHHVLRPRRVSHAPTHLNVSIVRNNTKWMILNAHFENIASIESDISRNPKSLEKSKPTPFAQLWAVNPYKY